MIERILRGIEQLIPAPLYRFFQPAYHFLLAFLAAIIYRFPSRRLTVILVTGTKGKTSVAELLSSILEVNGGTTALLGTLRFKLGGENRRNMRKMTIPGRFFVQRFLRSAINAGCTHAVIEMTSEGAKQFRQRFIDMDALIFTNLAPEHIESHGSYEKYRDAKLSIARTLSRSSKAKRFMVANIDDPEGARFLAMKNVRPVPYSLTDGTPVEVDEKHTSLTFRGVRISSALPGMFNAANILAAAACAEALGIAPNVIAAGIRRVDRIEGRMERIDLGQEFPVIVDYAHTPGSLEAVYRTFPEHEKICVLGATGGGRDKWKRPVMGGIADTYCSSIILTDEDPYDEDPNEIIDGLREGVKKNVPEMILDRRQAIARAIAIAKETKNAAVLITGKGTDPYIMGPHGSKTPWDDREVTRAELKKALPHS